MLPPVPHNVDRLPARLLLPPQLQPGPGAGEAGPAPGVWAGAGGGGV